jgi:uncharacterized protein (UPF0276 family)
MPDRWDHPNFGFGLALVHLHYRQVVAQRPPVDFYELITENFLETEGYPSHLVDQLSDRGPVLLHGVNLSIGGSDPLDPDYLKKLKRLARRVNARYVSDHLCWTGHRGIVAHDFLPVPNTEEALRHVVERIRQVQDTIELPLVLENPSTYLAYTSSSMPEWEFLTRMAEAADCGLLLDVNNVYVSAYNHGFDPRTYIDAIPVERIVYHHLAGHTNLGAWIKDTHSDHVIEEVWRLYRYTQARTGGRTTLIEWDSDTPALSVLLDELARTRQEATRPLPQWEGEEPLPVRHMQAAAAASQPRPFALGALQETLQAYILEQPANVEIDAAALIVPTAAMTAHDRLDIYRTQFWGRVVVEMTWYYPHLRRFLGDDEFTALVHRYARAHPPRHWNIFRLRHGFPAFLKEIQQELPHPGFMYDLARFERAWRDVGDEPEVDKPAAHSDIDWETARLRLSPALRMLALDYAVNEFTLGQPAQLEPCPNWLMLYRGADYEMFRLPLGSLAYKLLRLLERGVPAGVAVRRSFAGEGLSDTMRTFLELLIERGIIASVDNADPADANTQRPASMVASTRTV